MKTATIIQARMTSTRLPGKVLRPVLGRPLLDFMIERLKRMNHSEQIIVATTTNQADDPIVNLAIRRGVGYVRGSEHDVLSRVLLAAHQYQVDLIVETTADCPVIDPVLSDQVVTLFRQNGNLDYASNVLTRSYPRGMDTQVFPTKILEEVARLTQDPVDREHVSLYIYHHPEKFSLANLAAPRECYQPELRLTVDTMEDFLLIEQIITHLSPKNPNFSLQDMLRFLQDNPTLYELNRHIQQKQVENEQQNTQNPPVPC